MLATHSKIHCRRAFTLVELMVAAALSITIMWILAEAFKMGIDFARSAHSTGDMMSQLNNTGQVMMRDLGQTGALSSSSQAQHYLNAYSSTGATVVGSMRNASVSMPDNLNALTALGAYSTNATGYTPPAGYFMLHSPPVNPAGPLPSWAQYQDNSEFFWITTMNPLTDTVHGTGTIVKFTCFLPPGLPQNQFIATVPPGSNNIYYSRAAEIVYFLAPSGLQTNPIAATASLTANQPQLLTTVNGRLGTAPMPLYTLYRRQRLVAVTPDYAQSVMPGATAATSVPVPPNLNAPFTPTSPYYAFNPASPYYDPFVADVISVTPMPAGQPTAYQVNTLTSFGTAYQLVQPKGAVLQPIPATRVQAVPLGSAGTSPARVGDDILMSNVLSFEVLASWDPPLPNNVVQPPAAAKLPVPPPRPFLNPATGAILNSNYPYDNLPLLNFNPAYPTYTFDTWYKYISIQASAIQPNNNWNNFSRLPANPNLIPMPIRINSIQINVRIYDPKTGQARQNTWRVSI